MKTTNSRKATHQGTCQCCGATQKLPAGLLSLHGYTRPDGYFEGVCRGAGHQPLELSADLLPELITGARAEVERLGTFAALVERGEHTHVRVRNPERRTRKAQPYILVPRAEMAAHDLDALDRQWAAALRATARHYAEYAERQQAKLDAWTPRPEALITVKEAAQAKVEAQEAVKAERAAKKAAQAAKPKVWTSSNCAFLSDAQAAILYVGDLYEKAFEKARKQVAAAFRDQGPEAALRVLTGLIQERVTLAGIDLKMVGDPYGPAHKDCLNWLELSHALREKGVK